MDKRLKDFDEITELTRNSLSHVTSELEEDKKILFGNLIKQVCALTENSDISGKSLITILQSLFSTEAPVVGEILIWPHTDTSPLTNALLCDGSAISRTTYADLFTLLGTYYGSGDGSTTFNIPDLRGYFIELNDNSIGSTASYNTAKNGLSLADYSHRHYLNGPIENSPNPYGVPIADTTIGSGENPNDTETAGSHNHAFGGFYDGDNETRPMNIYMDGFIVYG